MTFNLKKNLIDPIRNLKGLKASSTEIALGLAIGIFVSVMFPYGSHFFAALFFAWILRAEKISAAVGTLFNNPFTALPIYFFGWRVGAYMLDLDPSLMNMNAGSLTNAETFWEAFLSLGQDILLPMLAGLFVLALLCAIISFFVAKAWIEMLRRRQKEAFCNTPDKS